MIHSLLTLLVEVAILGLFAWAILTIVPMPAQIRTVVIVIVCLIALLLVFQVLDGGALRLSDARGHDQFNLLGSSVIEPGRLGSQGHR